MKPPVFKAYKGECDRRPYHVYNPMKPYGIQVYEFSEPKTPVRKAPAKKAAAEKAAEKTAAKKTAVKKTAAKKTTAKKTAAE